jgi:hypothetical protein
MPMDALNHTCYMEYRQVKTLLMKTYNTAYIKLQTSRNKNLTMKALHVNDISSVSIILSSVINLLNANYVWVAGIAKTNVATHTNAIRLPFYVKFT